MPESRKPWSGLACALAVGWGLAFLAAAPAVAQTPAASPAPPASNEAGPEAELGQVTAPVVLDGETLFRVRGVTVYPAEQRARLISGRIEEVARTETIAPEAVRAVLANELMSIVANDQFLMAVTDADAHLEAADRKSLAQALADRIQRAIRAYREARQPEVLLAGARRALAATALLAFALLGLAWSFRRVEARFTRRYEERIRSVQFQSFEILRAQHLRTAFRAAMTVVRTVTTAGLVYSCLHFVLSSFPATRSLAARLLTLVLEPLRYLASGLAARLPDLAFLLVLFVLTRWVLGLTRLFFDAVAKGHVALSSFEPEWALPTYRIVRMVAVAFALVVAYPYIPGSGSAAFQGISIFLGVLFSLGSSSVLSNMIAGYSMTYRRAFHLGDRIQVGDVSGDVTEIRLQVTHLRTVKNEEVVIPNSALLNSNVVNYSALARSRGLILHTTVGIGYETPWRQVEAMLLMAAERTPGLLPEPKPFVLHKSLGDFCVVYEINVYCDQPNAMGAFYTDLHRNILDVFNEYGVQIMTPAYEGDPEDPKVVPKASWWSAPAQPPPGSSVPGPTGSEPSHPTSR